MEVSISLAIGHTIQTTRETIMDAIIDDIVVGDVGLLAMFSMAMTGATVRLHVEVPKKNQHAHHVTHQKVLAPVRELTAIHDCIHRMGERDQKLGLKMK